MPTGLTKDAGWQIGVSRAVAAPRERVWEVLTSPEGLAVWLGEGAALPAGRGETYRTADGIEGELRSLRPLDRVRLTWRPPSRDEDTTLQIALSPAARGTTVRFHHDRLADADERERMREHWRATLDRLEALL